MKLKHEFDWPERTPPSHCAALGPRGPVPTAVTAAQAAPFIRGPWLAGQRGLLVQPPLSSSPSQLSP